MNSEALHGCVLGHSWERFKSPSPRVTHGIDLRQTRHESLMGSFYVDYFHVDRCNDSKASDLHGVVLRKSSTYCRLCKLL